MPGGVSVGLREGETVTFSLNGIESWFGGLGKAFGQVGQNIQTSVGEAAHGITSSIGETFHQLDQMTLGAAISTEKNVATSVGETAHGITTSVSQAGHGVSDWAGQFGKMFTGTFKWILIIVAIVIIAIIVIKVM